ncbi:thioredoxin-like domain-containing protein [Faecalibacter sp. LW9]|uniref:TlpA family protein disulfide reductase n=1 Tax=Faecalibacter sp. LW9 TaxID=3103144 RepID=UPI002AFF94A1|nr:thioredoxin-like domain-containing protein [Faecalibacter sp. LW9]
MKSIFTFLCITFACIFSQAQSATVEIPAHLPEFQLIKIKGEGIFDSKDIAKNKKTLLGYVSPECIHCLLSLELINHNMELLKDVNIIFVTEYDQSEFEAKVKPIAPKLFEAKNVEILRDSEYEMPEKLKLTTLPTYFLFDKKGTTETMKRGSIEVVQIFNHLK